MYTIDDRACDVILMGETGMSRIRKYLYENGMLRCIVISLITAIVTFAPFIYRGGGAFTVVDDFDSQVLPFAAAVWNTIHSDDIGQWVWNLDLGSSLITGFSFYNLGSPFYWISLLFPRGSYPYLAGPLYMVKYVVASLTAYIYLCHFIRDNGPHGKDCAIIGALLYAFSGFQTTNLEFHFHDAVAFFPLLLWGIENIDNRTKRPAFIAAIWINCLVNYFFFIQEVVFMVIYYVVRYWNEDIRTFIRRAFACIVCGLLGVGMAAVLFLPSILYIMGNDRSDMALYLNNLVYDSKSLLFMLKGMIMPGDAMQDHSALRSQVWDSTSCYLPLTGLSLVFAFMRKSHSWIKHLLILLFVISFLPIAQSGFLLFTVVYQRWWFMFVLIMALASVQVLEQRDLYPISQ